MDEVIGRRNVDKLLARGKTRKEAIRLLRRRLSDVVFRPDASRFDFKKRNARRKGDWLCA